MSAEPFTPRLNLVKSQAYVANVTIKIPAAIDAVGAGLDRLSAPAGSASQILE